MNFLKVLIVLFPFFLGTLVFSQQTVKVCASELNSRDWETPSFYNQLNQIKNNSNSRTVYTIPIVFHIIHNGGPENVSDSAINSWMSDLNQQFSNTGVFRDTVLGLSIDIQFCLATQDTNGNPTTGINRYSTPKSDMYQYLLANGLPVTYPLSNELAASYHWNTNDYFNVYVVKNLTVFGNGYAGWGYYPSNHGMSHDGIYLDYNYLDRSDNTYFREGVLSHEAGHYLGLYHTFETSCINLNCEQDNDKVCDTPPENSATLTCITSNTCNTDSQDPRSINPFRATAIGGLGDVDDDNTNYMDYTKCVKQHFTLGQKNRMTASLLGPRNSLLISNGCGANSAGVSQNASSIEIKVFPNPFTNQIEFELEAEGLYTFSLYSLQGAKIGTYDLDKSNTKLMFPSLAKGIYVYTISNSTGLVSNGKIVKQ